MSDFFYSGQMRRYLTQFIRAMSNFSYSSNTGQITRVPTRYGDMSRQVGAVLNKNSENVMSSAPFIACYIKDLQFDQSRLQDPTFVKKYNIRDRAMDPTTGKYIYQQGAGYTVETIMPSPYMVTFNADVWTTNTDQKLQIWEQIAVIFNPALELQTTNNYIDWTSLTYLRLDSMVFSSRTIPQGVDQSIDIMNLSFKTPIWITPPAKVKQLGIITKIIASVHNVPEGSVENDYNDPLGIYNFDPPDAQVVVTPGNFELLVLDGVAMLATNEIHSYQNITSAPAHSTNWYSLLDLYPGQFRAGLSQIRLAKSDGSEVVAYARLDPKNDDRMLLTYDTDTIPANTILSNGRGTVDAIINPETFSPTNTTQGTTYLILEGINLLKGTPGYVGPVAWQNANQTQFQANANDIIQWDGQQWNIIFDSTVPQEPTYITNSYTGIQYAWNGEQWSKSFEGIYDKLSWRLVL